MTLEEIRQKMEELSVSEGYLADCCGVDKRYIRQCVTKGSKPMTKVYIEMLVFISHRVPLLFEYFLTYVSYEFLLVIHRFLGLIAHSERFPVPHNRAVRKIVIDRRRDR